MREGSTPQSLSDLSNGIPFFQSIPVLDLKRVK